VVEEFPTEKQEAILAINLSAVLLGIAAAVPQMKGRRYIAVMVDGPLSTGVKCLKYNTIRRMIGAEGQPPPRTQ
jgi:NAD(P)-dependent dehydrogenase (short-subunit alcohol dehydrogenase family)